MRDTAIIKKTVLEYTGLKASAVSVKHDRGSAYGWILVRIKEADFLHEYAECNDYFKQRECASKIEREIVENHSDLLSTYIQDDGYGTESKRISVSIS